MLKHYVERAVAGSFVSDYSSREVEDRDPDKIILGTMEYGFRFYDIEEVELDGELLRGKPKNHSKWYYQGEEYTLEQVKRELPGSRILIENMECNGWNTVVKNKFGQFFPLINGAVVIK